MPEETLNVLALLALAALAAGYVDAVVGGGGLIQLPALLLFLPGAAPVQILATNKLASVFGTSISAATYYRRVGPDPKTFIPLMILAFVGSTMGAGVASYLPEEVFEPIVLVALVLVGAWVVFKPQLGAATKLKFDDHRHVIGAMVVGFAVGFYDGALGPGTGSFLVIGLVGLLGYSFLEASAKAKMANVATNLAALAVFIPQGAVMWRIGLMMGVCNLIGGYLGARTAVAKGAGFVRAFFVVVVVGFIIRLGGSVLGIW